MSAGLAASLLACPPLGSLVFQPPGFGWLGSLIIALSVVAAALAYTVGTRWRHAQPTRFALLGLRLGALVCLFLTLLHPAWISQRTSDEKPIVAVVLDDSVSMAEPAEGTGGVRASRPQKGTEARRHEGRRVGHESEPEPVAAGAPAGRGNVAADPRVGRSGDAGSRYARAVAVLRGELATTLEQSHRLRLYDAQARALRIDHLPPAPTGRRSPLTDTLLRVQRDLRSAPLVGIVLLSDGAEMSERPTIGGVEQLRMPVHTIDVCAGDAGGSAMPDLAIQAVSANRRALVGNTVRVTVDITADGSRAENIVSIALLDSKRTVASRRLRAEPVGPVSNRSEMLAGSRWQRRVELDFVPRRPGEFTYTVAVSGLPNEADLDNNRSTFPLTVSAKPLTVLYIDGVLRWEGKFIREALAADPDINLVSAVRTVRAGADRGSQGLLLPEQLANIDVVILGDVEAGYFSTSDELQALCTWVTDAGGGLLLTGGYRSFGPEGFGRTALRDVLPVEFSAAANPQAEQSFNLKLTEVGREHPLFHLTGDRLRDTAFFHRLPPLDGCSRIAGVKPGAEVLAVNPQITGPGGKRGLPVLVVQQVGAGRTMVLAVDTTWRWRTIVGGFTGDCSFYERFWGQLVRWLASDEDEASPQLFVSTDRTRYQLGETIELSIALRNPVAEQSNVAAGLRAGRRRHGREDAAMPPDRLETGPTKDVAADPRVGRGMRLVDTRWKVTARMLDEGGRQVDIPLAELGDGKYRGTLGAQRPGRLDLMVTAEPAPGSAPDVTAGAPAGRDDEDALAQSQSVTVHVDHPDLERRDPRGNPQWLARVSQLTGGRSLRPDDVQTLAVQLPSDPVMTTVVRTSGVWGDRLFGSAFVALLCAEWILRRRSQLA